VRRPSDLAAVWNRWSPTGLKPAVALATSTLCLLTWWYFGSPAFFERRLAAAAASWPVPVTSAQYCFLSAVLWLAVIPAAIVKLGFRESLASYGVQMGDRRWSSGAMIVLVPVFVLVGYLSSRDPAIRAAYPLDDQAGSSMAAFLTHAAAYLLFYVAWEFHFRGFLQFGLRESCGDSNAILIQCLASCLTHLGKPAAESYAALLGGLLWGFLALRSRSLLSGIAQHWALGISLDAFLIRAP
jgi:membrane protease YdiL (CAAX protease family)